MPAPHPSHPNYVPVSTIAAGADDASDYGDHSTSAVARKSMAEILGAVGFGGIIAGFSALATYLTTTLAPTSWYAGIASSIASPEGLLLTAAIAGAAGVISMIASTNIKNNMDAEQHARAKCEKKEPQVVVVPSQDISVSQTTQQGLSSMEEKVKELYADMIKRQNLEKSKVRTCP